MKLNLDRSDWQKVKFGDVVMRVTDTGLPTSSESLLYVGLENMPTDGSVTIRSWGSEVDIAVPKTRVTAGDVLFARRNTALRRVAVAPHDGYFSPDGYALRAIEGRLSHEFLPWVVASDAFMDHAVRHSAGTHSKRVKWSDLATYEFDMPPLDQQRRIANLLWSCETTHQACAAESRALSAFRASFIDSRFGVSASAVPLTTLVAPDGIRIGPFGAQLHAADYVDDGVPVVMPQDMVDGFISTESIQRVSRVKADELLAHALVAGDVLLPRRGELDRRALVLPEQEGWLCGTGSVRVRPRADIDHRAIFLALSASSTVDWLRRNASGTTMPNLNASIVARIPVSLPSSAELNGALSVVEQLAEGVAKAEAQAAALSKLKSGLLDSVIEGSS